MFSSVLWHKSECDGLLKWLRIGFDALVVDWILRCRRPVYVTREKSWLNIMRSKNMLRKQIGWISLNNNASFPSNLLDLRCFVWYFKHINNSRYTCLSFDIVPGTEHLTAVYTYQIEWCVFVSITVMGMCFMVERDELSYPQSQLH